MIETNSILQQNIKYVVNCFLADNIRVCNDWLTECIDFFSSDTPGISKENLFTKAKSQWLLADLHEVGQGCFPANVETVIEEFVLEGKYPVQMQWLVNIAEPFYDQWRSIYDKQIDDVEEPDEFVQTYANRKDKNKKARIFKLELTDGKRNVTAMEYRHIPCLTTKLTPGSKILLTGRIRCVNKVLFLESKNVRILGGEVDTLLIPNAYENILLKALNKPINEHPKFDYVEPAVLENIPCNRTINVTEQNPFNPTPRPMAQARPVQQSHNLPPVEPMDDDDIFMGINLDELEQQISQNGPSAAPTISASSRPTNLRNTSTTTQPKLPSRQISIPTRPPLPSRQTFPDDDDDDLDYFNLIENEIKRENNVRPNNDCIPPSPPSTNTARKRPTPPSVSKFTASNRLQNFDQSTVRPNQPPSPERNIPGPPDSLARTVSRPEKNFDLVDYSQLFDSMDAFDDPELLKIVDQPTKNITILDDEYKFKINNHSVVTIEELTKFTSTEKLNKSFIIFAEVSNITAKFQIKSDAFLLRVNLFDFTGVQIEIIFHNDILAKLVGYQPSELWAMRSKQKEMKHIRHTLDEIIQKFRKNLQELHLFMRIMFSVDEEFPMIEELIDMTDANKKVLLNKIEAESLPNVIF